MTKEHSLLNSERSSWMIKMRWIHLMDVTSLPLVKQAIIKLKFKQTSKLPMI
jgi:hypothetical protein